MYKVPSEFYFQIHHVRPRFKDNIESVLIYIANKITVIGEQKSKKFKQELIESLYQFPGNNDKKEKTVNNWRTEISALFGFFIDNKIVTRPGEIASLLSNNGDLPEMFNYFLYKFQYPGAHTKENYTEEQINNHIKFQPAKYILNVLSVATQKNPEQPYLTISECTHCIFNDLRCTRINHEPYEITWDRIVSNRIQKVLYDTKGDVTRYSKDIMDYMKIAGLLNELNNSFYLNSLSKNAISKIKNNQESFNGYDDMITKGKGIKEDIKSLKVSWFEYVNDIDKIDLATDVFAYINNSLESYNNEKERIEKAIQNNLDYKNTKEVGDQGEGIVYKYETDTLTAKSREDLVHLVTFIPTKLSVGYDFNSIEPDNELRRYIEVKSTISSSSLVVNSFHLTPNEVRTARTVGEHYFVYRLKIMRDKRPTLIIIQDPMKLLENNSISTNENMKNNGLDIIYSPSQFKEIEV